MIGYNVILATAADEAWKCLQDPKNDIALVITDVNMPGEYDGFGLLDRVTKLKEEQGIDVIMMSGQEDVVVKGVTSGSKDFLAKPIVRALLLRKVETLVQHRQSKMALHQERMEKEVLLKEIAALSVHHFGENLVETPIQTINASLVNLLHRSDLNPEVRGELVRLKTTAGQAASLYRVSAPGVQSSKKFDDVTKSFLLSELAVNPHSVSGNALDTENIRTFSTVLIDGPAVAELTQWSFNVFERTEDELLVLAKQMFIHFDLLNHFDIKTEVLERFLVAVKQNYNANPYHNWYHAFDVTQATFCYLTHFQGHTLLTQLDLLGLLVASLCHDLGHPGVNNAFMTSQDSDIAILYNDQSVLENFHAASLFQLIRKHSELNIFASLNKPQYREIRKTIIECIIATDPAVHYEYVSKLSAKAESDSPVWNANSPEQRLLLMKSILKMADISNVARLWDGPGYAWSLRVSQEFFTQGDREKSLGLEVAAFLDRDATTISKNSMNFIDFVAAPLFLNMGKLNADFEDQVVTILTLNRHRWELESHKDKKEDRK